MYVLLLAVMLKKNTHIQLKAKSKSLLFAALNCFTVALFLFFIIGGQSTALAHTTKYKNVVQLTSNILSSDTEISNPESPVDYPVGPAVSIDASEVNDSDETQQDSNHDLTAFLFAPAAKVGIAAAYQDNFIQLSTTAAQKRSTVSLFILYHSWKSFLI